MMLFSSISVHNNEIASNKAIAAFDSTLVGYWDMETLTGGLLRDFSSKGNNANIANNLTIGTAA